MATPQEIEQQRLLNQQLLGQAIKVQDQDEYPSASLALGDSILGFAQQNAAPTEQVTVAPSPAPKQSSFLDKVIGGISAVTSLRDIPKTAGRVGQLAGEQLLGTGLDAQGNVTGRPVAEGTLPSGVLKTIGAGLGLTGQAAQGVGRGLEFITAMDIVEGGPVGPAARDRSAVPYVPPVSPAGTGTVLQGIRDMDTQAALPAFQEIQGIDPNAPVQSAPEGMVRTIDPSTGQLILADKATAAQFSETINARRKADFEAQQRAIQQISSSGIGYRLAEQEVAREQAASAAREARMASRPDFMESVSDSQRRGDGLSDSEMRRYIKGKNPNASDREKAYSARIDMQRRDEATQTAAQQAMDLAQMRIDASVESQDKTIAAQQEAAKVAQENALKLAMIRKQLSPSQAREAELKIIKLEQDAAAGQQVDPSDIQKILTSVGVPTLNDIKYDAQRDVFVNTKGIDDTFGPESAAYRVLAGTKVGRAIMGSGPNMKVISTRPSQG